jgi:hypothetical protein
MTPDEFDHELLKQPANLRGTVVPRLASRIRFAKVDSVSRVLLDVPVRDGCFEYRRKRRAHAAKRCDGVAFPLQPRQTPFDLRAADVPDGHFAERRKNMLIEVETVDTHA